MARREAVGRSRRGLLLALVVVTAMTAYVGLDIVDVVPGGLTRAQPSPSGPGPSGAPAGPQLADPAALALRPVSIDAAAPTTTGLTRVLGTLLRQPALGGSVGVDVRDGVTGAILFRRDAARPRTPASAAKILTAAALASTDELDDGMPTRAVAGARTGEVVLVAGGDTLLSPGRGKPGSVVGRAGLGDLADQVAGRLRPAGVARVSVRLDPSSAAGPALAPGWNRADVRAGFVGPVATIGMTTTRAVAGRPAPADPAVAALKAFAAALRQRGIDVSGADVGDAGRRPAAGPTPEGLASLPPGASLGEVVSAPVRDVLALALAESDNAITEGLARRGAAADQAGTSFAAVGAWVRGRIAALGVDVTTVRLVDASGLSSASRVPATTLTDTLMLAATGRLTGLAQVVAQLPVAGLSGTLHDRFRSPATRPGAGLVRAKTGTLTGVSTLAGTVVDADGRLLVFTVMADRVPAGGTPAARVSLDRLVTALAGCGCR